MSTSTTVRTVPVGDRWADLNDHDTFRGGVPHATFDRLREEEPLSWWESEDGGFWSIVRYEDIITTNRDFKTFTSSQGIRIEEMDDEEREARRTLMEMDPPEHTRLRRLVQGGFTRRMVETYEARVRELAVEIIEAALERERFDFVIDVARQLPMRMLGRLLGLPDDDLDRLVELGDALIGNTDPEFTDTPVGLSDTDEYRLLPFRSPASRDLFAYAEEVARDRRANPRDDVVTKLLSPVDDSGETLDELEFKNFFTLMVAAGNDTTRYSTAGALLALIDHPDAMRTLQQDASLMPNAVEEMLRWTSVTMHFRRTATHDVEMHGRTIHEGDPVVLWWISGDYDWRRFEDPYTFDIHRENNEHLAFGRGGPHRCLGEWLARMEIRVVFEELLPRVREIGMAGPIDRLRSNFISGIKHMPIEVVRA